MSDQPQKGNIPASDSGYLSGYASLDEADAKKIAGARTKEAGAFKKLMLALTTLELSGDEDAQSKRLDDYLDNQITDINNPKIIKDECQFARVDDAIKGLCKTKLKGNEGAALLAIAQGCANVAILKRVIEIISIEKDIAVEKLIKNFLPTYVDTDGYNLLHHLANVIVKKSDRGHPISEKDWAAFNYFKAQCPVLLEQKEQLSDLTPEEIVWLNTNLTCENPYSYAMPVEPSGLLPNTHQFF